VSEKLAKRERMPGRKESVTRKSGDLRNKRKKRQEEKGKSKRGMSWSTTYGRGVSAFYD
jgi:hypothetical protein